MTTIRLNPYAQHLGDRDPLTVLRATVPALHERLRKLAPRVDVRPGPGRWSAREIVCHLADVESVHLVRLRQSLAEEHHVIQPFDQDRWAARYVGRDLATALAAFEATRAWLLAFAAELDDSDLARPVTHPERGTLSVRVLLETF